eukprot:Sdes_comp8778_c0_seq1m149
MLLFGEHRGKLFHPPKNVETSSASSSHLPEISLLEKDSTKIPQLNFAKRCQYFHFLTKSNLAENHSVQDLIKLEFSCFQNSKTLLGYKNNIMKLKCKNSMKS